ncbi:Uncharacterised protein [Kocuria rhizophila]|nr:Uncharacterised protein [Kocuria rhizophila]
MHYSAEASTLTSTVRHQQTDMSDRLGGPAKNHVSKGDEFLTVPQAKINFLRVQHARR